jgi:hypothetical protein
MRKVLALHDQLRKSIHAEGAEEQAERRNHSPKIIWSQQSGKNHRGPYLHKKGSTLPEKRYADAPNSRSPQSMALSDRVKITVGIKRNQLSRHRRIVCVSGDRVFQAFAGRHFVGRGVVRSRNLPGCGIKITSRDATRTDYGSKQEDPHRR